MYIISLLFFHFTDGCLEVRLTKIKPQVKPHPSNRRPTASNDDPRDTVSSTQFPFVIGGLFGTVYSPVSWSTPGRFVCVLSRDASVLNAAKCTKKQRESVHTVTTDLRHVLNDPSLKERNKRMSPMTSNNLRRTSCVNRTTDQSDYSFKKFTNRKAAGTFCLSLYCNIYHRHPVPLPHPLHSLTYSLEHKFSASVLRRIPP